MAAQNPDQIGLDTVRLAVIGAGNMGGAIVQGLVASGALQPSQIQVANRSERRLAPLADLGVGTGTDNQAAVQHADVVLLGVKPAMLAEVAGSLDLQPGTVLVSIAAGLTTTVVEQAQPQAHVVRAMPNTPAKVGQALTSISPGSSADAADVALVRALFDAIGSTVVIDEAQQSIAIALSGSGVAYLYLVAEAMIEGGVTLGMPRDQATQVIVQTFTGAAAMLETGEHPGLLREQVTSPGGTTAAALQTLEAHGLRTALLEAMRAAVARDAELGR